MERVVIKKKGHGNEMKYGWIAPAGEKRKDFKVIEYIIESSDKIYRYALDKAPELAKEMNGYSPSGKERDAKTILANCFAGCIAEAAIIYRLNAYAKELKKNVQAKPTLFDKNRDEDQVDILVYEEDNAEASPVSIEVRSSYGAVQNNFKRYTEWFSIVGNYTSENKGKELVKDYYITVIFNFPQEDMYQKMADKEPVYFQLAAGCSRDFLEKNGEVDDLKNEGAEYMIVKPLIKGCSVDEVMNQIFDNFSLQGDC